MARCPKAIWAPITGCPGIPWTKPPRLGCGHTFEVKGDYRYNPARYGTGATPSPPHATISVTPGVIHQHIDTDYAAYALVNSGIPGETNRAGLVQVELMWKAAEIEDAPQSLLDNFEIWADWLWTEHRIEKSFPVEFLPYPESYGQTAVRLTHAEMDALVSGHIAHENVPENDHGDWGAFPTHRVFQIPTATTTAVVPVHGFTDFEEGQMRKALVGSGPPNQFAIANPRWDPGFDRPPNVIGVVPNGLVQLRSQIGAHVEGNDVVLDIAMVDVNGQILPPFDVHVTVS